MLHLKVAAIDEIKPDPVGIRWTILWGGFIHIGGHHAVVQVDVAARP